MKLKEKKLMMSKGLYRLIIFSEKVIYPQYPLYKQSPSSKTWFVTEFCVYFRTWSFDVSAECFASFCFSKLWNLREKQK